jgi:luciferase family oxidoreductase group 1
LRRNLGGSGDTFPQDVLELQSFFAGTTLGIQAIPGTGLNVPLYLLGSSDFSARLAAELGLPFAFASHFAPDYLEVALAVYRREFRPSAALDRPYVMIGAGVFAAETDAEARRLFTSAQLQFLSLIRGRPGKLPPPVDRIDEFCTPAELAAINERTRCSAVGSPATVRRRLQALLEQTGADEVIATGQIYDHAARLRSFQIAAEVFREINAPSGR